MIMVTGYAKSGRWTCKDGLGVGAPPGERAGMRGMRLLGAVPRGASAASSLRRAAGSATLGGERALDSR
jgi:hypothetical protein